MREYNWVPYSAAKKVFQRIVVYSTIVFFCIICWGVAMYFIPWILFNSWKF